MKKFTDSARIIRRTVFEDEQGFIDDFNETDEIAMHFVTKNSWKIVV